MLEETSSEVDLRSEAGAVTDTRSSVPAIRVEDVSKVYNLYRAPSDRLKQMLYGWRRPFYSEFPALKNISLEVARGETVGIVGRNGSGKSTLLQIICGTVAATSGRVDVNGRIAALLELGAGFNPEFSGRENVHLNGSILGLTRAQMEERFDSIAEFADIGDFIEQPVKTYSSGMYVRLAFAVAINADPDVLVIDEALSVGDEAFRRKCFARIEQIKNSGATILFVSHSAGSILQLCSRAILLDKGEKLVEGHPKLVINHYQRLSNLSGKEAESVRAEIMAAATPGHADHESAPKIVPTLKPQSPSTQEQYNPNLVSTSKIEFESKGAKISDLAILNEQGKPVNTLQLGRKYTYRFQVEFHRDLPSVAFGMLVKTTKGIDVVGCSTRSDPVLHLKSIKAGMKAEAQFEFLCNFRPSTYFVNAGVSNPESDDGTFLHRILDGLVFHVAPVENSTSTGIVDSGIVPQARIIAQP